MFIGEIALWNIVSAIVDNFVETLGWQIGFTLLIGWPLCDLFERLWKWIG